MATTTKAYQPEGDSPFDTEYRLWRQDPANLSWLTVEEADELAQCARLKATTPIYADDTELLRFAAALEHTLKAALERTVEAKS